jgi:DNA polymerase-3 subunit delta
MKNRQELDRAIASGTLPNAMMFFGESHFLIDRYLKILSSIDDANTLKLYHDEYNYEMAKAHLSQGSLFGDRNVLVIKSEKKVPKNELDKLLEFCKKNSDNIFLYGYYGDDYKTSNKAFSKKAGGDSVRLYNPFAGEAINIVKQEAQRLGAQLDHYSIQHLLSTQNGDIALACNELEKLAILQMPITIKEIDDLVYGVAEVRIEQLIISLLEKQDFKENLERILESGESEVQLLTALSGYVAQLYMFYMYIKINGFPDAKAILGYSPPKFVVEQKAKLSMKFNQHKYEKVLTLLLDCELQMKSGVKTDNYSLLLSSLLRLQSII